MSDRADFAFTKARAIGEAALGRLPRFNEPGRMSLAGAYALGYGALGMAQIDDDGPGWYHQLDPLDALFLGAATPQRFASGYEFANARDQWLELLRDTVHWRGIETFVGLVVRASDEFRRPVDDGGLMLAVLGRAEDARLDQRKLPRALLPASETGLPTSRLTAGPSAGTVLPDAAHDATELVTSFWKSTELDIGVEHDGSAADALREGIWLLRRAGLIAADEPLLLVPALYLALVAGEDELLDEMPERAEAWVGGLSDDSPLIPVIDTIRGGAAQHLTSSEIIARLFGFPAFTTQVRAEDRAWHSDPGHALQSIAFRLGFTEICTRDHTVRKLSEEAAAALRLQRERFHDKFGRPPAPDEPLFFDPDADEPTTLNPVDVEHASVARLEALGVAPAWIYATQHTDGLLPLLDGSFHNSDDRQQWNEAVARYLSTHPGMVVDTNAELRKLRIGAAVASLNMATGNPQYAASLIERMPGAAARDHSDASLVRTVLESMADDLLDLLKTDAATAEKAKEFARAWHGADLADAVEQARANDAPADPAVLLAAFAASSGTAESGTSDVGADVDPEADDVCEQLVTEILEHDDTDLPLDLITSLTELDDQDEGGRLIAVLIGRATGYLVNMRDHGVTPDQITAAVNWLGNTLGAEYAGPAAAASALAGHPEGEAVIARHAGVEEPTFNDLSDLLGIHLLPGMIWLSTGLVATVGDGDVTWLSQYRVGR
jgi:hypothetical protein